MGEGPPALAGRLPAGSSAEQELPLLLAAADLPHQRVEHVVHKVPQGSRRLVERAVHLPRKRLALLGGHLPRALQVALVSHQHHGHEFRATDALNLFPALRRFLKAPAVGDCIADDEALAAAHVLVSHGREFDLSSSVQNVQQGHFSINDSLLLIGILDGWIVVLQKTVSHELQRESALPNTSITENHYFVDSDAAFLRRRMTGTTVRCLHHLARLEKGFLAGNTGAKAEPVKTPLVVLRSRTAAVNTAVSLAICYSPERWQGRYDSEVLNKAILR